jgi:dTDP-4-amino-4,6-dideoxygalactose transaminase
MKDKKIFVTKSSMPDFNRYCELIHRIWDTHYMTNNGPLHDELCERIKEFLGVSNVTLFTNGHLSLENALQALDLHGEIITTPFTFVSTTHAIARTGNIPVFCDINPDNYTIDADKIESLITDKTCAILPVHVYGNVCDVEKIEKIARKYNLKVIYDAAHAFGVKYKGKSIACYGDMSMFSFHATKVFNTIEGGALVYDNPNFTRVLNNLKNFGIVSEEDVEYIGGNAKMNEFQAAMGLLNLDNLIDNIEKRKKVVLKYIELLSKIEGIKLNAVADDVESNFAYFPIVVEDSYGLSRNQLYELLKKYDIYSRKYFYPISNDFEMYANCRGETPIAHDISERVLTLPLYPDLSINTVCKICKIIKNKK